MRGPHAGRRKWSEFLAGKEVFECSRARRHRGWRCVRPQRWRCVRTYACVRREYKGLECWMKYCYVYSYCERNLIWKMNCLHGKPAAYSTTSNGSFWFCNQNPRSMVLESRSIKCLSLYLWNSLGTQGRVKMRPIASPEVSFDKMCQPMEQSYGTQGHIKMRPAAWSWTPVR